MTTDPKPNKPSVSRQTQLLLKIFPGHELVGEINACLGIDIQAPLGAPGREGVGVDDDLIDYTSGLFEIAKIALGFSKPAVESGRKHMGVDENLPEPLVVLSAVPGHASIFWNTRNQNDLLNKRSTVSPDEQFARAPSKEQKP